MLTRRLFLSLLATPAFAQKKPMVAVSFSLLEDVLKNVAGDAVTSFSLVGAEQEVHHFSPRPQDLARLKQADFLLLNGLHLEHGLEKLAVKKIIASKRVTAIPNDPHAFLSLSNMALYVDEMAAHLPCPHAESYKAKLKALDEEIKAGFVLIPKEKRKIVTSHDAFAYFGQAYGIEFLAPAGKLGGEPTAENLARVIAQIKQNNIKALFVENLTSKKALETIAKETGAKIGGTLYAESLAKAGEASSYLGLMSHNARLMREAMA